MNKKYTKTAIVIEGIPGPDWAVSFTNSNPDREDCVDCKTKDDAWRLKGIWDEVMKSHSTPTEP